MRVKPSSLLKISSAYPNCSLVKFVCFFFLDEGIDEFRTLEFSDEVPPRELLNMYESSWVDL